MATDDRTPEIPMDEVLPAEEPSVEPDLPAVLPAPSPPHPNIWWSLLWCFGILATLYGTIIAAMLPMIGQAVISRMRAEKSSNDETNGRLEARENKPNPQEMSPAQKQEQARIANEE